MKNFEQDWNSCGDDDYRSEFEAPPFSILSQEAVGDTVETTVVIDGEVAVFETSQAMRQLAKLAARPFNERFDDIVGQLKDD